MNCCILIDEKEVLGEENYSWTTTRFTWGEGYQETEHDETVTRYSTAIKVFVDDLECYKKLNGLTEDAVLDYIPDPNSFTELSSLTGLRFFYNEYPRLNLNQDKDIPDLPTGVYVFLGGIKQNGHGSYYYKRVILCDSPEGMTLVRQLKALTKESIITYR